MAQVAFLSEAQRLLPSGRPLKPEQSCSRPGAERLPAAQTTGCPQTDLQPGCSRLFHIVKLFDLFVWVGLVFRSTAEIVTYWQRGHWVLHYISFTSLA